MRVVHLAAVPPEVPVELTELDRVAGTHNYGRRILRKWRQAGAGPLLPLRDSVMPHIEEAEVGAESG